MTSVFSKRPPTPEEMRRSNNGSTKDQTRGPNFFKKSDSANQNTNKQQSNFKSSDLQQSNQQQKNRHQSSSQHDQRRRTMNSSTRNDPDSSNQHRDPNNNPDSRYNFNNNNNGMRFVPGQSTRDLPPIETKMDPNFAKFVGRCRLFVGNLTHNINEQTVRDLFKQFGEVGEVFLGPKSAFAFVKMDYRKNAEMARDKLDGTMFENRTLRVRLAAHHAAIKVKNLSPAVSNELLAYSFRYFGEIERAVVITDEKGKSIGEGIVEFVKKPSALFALKKCQQDHFILTASPMPVLVEPFDQHDDEEGLPERSINKATSEFIKEREIGPRFASNDPGSFEESYAAKWKEIFQNEKLKREMLEKELQEARLTLQNQIEYSRLEHDAAQLKNKLKQLEDSRIRLQQYNDVNATQPVFGMYQTQTAGPSSSRQNQDIAFNNNNDEQSDNSTPVISEPLTTSSNANLMIPAVVNSQQRTYAETANMMNQQQYLQTMASQSMMQPMYGAAYQPQLSMNVFQQPQYQTYPNNMMPSNRPNTYATKKNFNNSYDDSDGNSGRARKRGRY